MMNLTVINLLCNEFTDDKFTTNHWNIYLISEFKQKHLPLNKI